MIEVEICCPSTASAEAAKQGGATRIELCHDLQCGGLTPTDADIAYCSRHLWLRTHVLVRPRAGNFVYNDREVADIMSTIARCRTLGATAVVVGFLTAEGGIDTHLTRLAVEAAEGMEVTFHRAFDELREPPSVALEKVIACGCHRLLTSGLCLTAEEGAYTIAALVRQSAGRIAIMAGSGVAPANARAIVAATGVGEIHGSCKRLRPDGTVQTDPEIVHQLITAIS